jgi:hypothetical protein
MFRPLMASVMLALLCGNPIAYGAGARPLPSGKHRFGVFVRVFELQEPVALAFAKDFESKAQVFKVCSSHAVEFQLRFTFAVDKAGHLQDPKLVEQTPPSAALAQCFAKYIKSLRFPRGDKEVRAEARIASYLGEKPPWLGEFEQKILEK